MKILIATDGSKPALHAVKYASKLALQLKSPRTHLTLISVHDDVALRHAKAFVGKDAVADYLRELSDQELKAARKVLNAAELRHDIVIKVGHVSQEIVEFAKAGKFDMIVLGAKGRGAWADALLGSVAQRVLSSASVPVLLIK